MSNSTNPRVVRKHFPKQVIAKTAYRKAFDYLVLDFENRCAYSMQHMYRTGGQKCMEVDHFNPRKKKDSIQQYENLFLATRHCNGSKRDRWPTNKDRQLGIRFLNCCKEVDYGVHIFEDPDSHEVVGVTPAGKYHVRNCDLNAPHLIAERAERAELRHILESRPVTIKGEWAYPVPAQDLKKMLEKMIPTIAYLSGEALEKHRARKKWLAEIGAKTV